MPVIGADSNGEVRILQSYGGRSLASIGGRDRVPGALNAFGLADNIPQPEIVEVVKEVQVEVEKIVEVERIVEVEKEVEVIQEVEVETISPISYVAIGLGVILVVIAGVLYSRAKSS